MKHFLLAMSVALASTASARDIHGVKGYYNFTGAQIVNDGLYVLSNGTKVEGYKSAASAFGDYAKINLGVNNTTASSGGNWSKSTCEWRTTFTLNPFSNNAYKTNITVTRNYPVVKMKVLLPADQDATYTQFWAEHMWDSPYTDAVDRVGMSPTQTVNGVKYPGFPAFGSNSRFGNYAEQWVGKKTQFDYTANKGLAAGIDSLKICNLNPTKETPQLTDAGGYYAYRTSNVKALTGATANDTTVVVYALPDTKTVDGKVYNEYVVMWNMYAIGDTTVTKDPSRLLDEISGFNIGHWGFNVQSWGYDYEQGEQPVFYIESFRTVGANIKEAMEGMTAENNWGDGTESVARQQLNYQLYYAELNLKNYSFRNTDPENPDDEAYITYKTAYETANTLYKAGGSDEDYAAAVDALQNARVALLTASDLSSGLVYNYVKSATGSGAIVIGADDVTVGSTTGKPLTIGSNAGAVAMSFVTTGNVENGQKTYTLSTSAGAVMQASDGTLLAVPGATGSTFTFSEFDVLGAGFSMHCGDYYYYINGNGVLSATTDIPEEASVDFDAMSAYLFNITDALADYSANAPESEKTGLKEGWEFNDAAVDDPGTYGVIDGVATKMGEYNETKMIEGWRASRWRMFSRASQWTGNGNTCLVLSSAATYNSYNGAATGIINDYTNPPALRMDAGKEEPFYKQDPSPRDSTWAFNVNPGIKRYFAVKAKMTGDATFGSMTFFNIVNGNGLDMTKPSGQKGDVYYYDLLQNGFAVGKKLFSSMFFSPAGFSHAGDVMVIDWMRFYDTIDAIPSEELGDITTGVQGVGTAGAQQPTDDNVYTLQGQKAGKDNTTLPAGIYVKKNKTFLVK